jgi:hypothetical protein
MHRSSATIGALATALAKAQGELTNPEKALTATIQSPFPTQGERTFRYASLASGLDIARKCLGQHEIATIQATDIDRDGGLIRLTTTLVHASGEWVSSDWPVCPVSETVAPQRLGAALTYARRYALFTLVGIAGEDDLDAPELATQSEQPRPEQLALRKASNGNVHTSRRLPLAVDQSRQLRERLRQEISVITDEDALAVWAHRSLPLKNTLTAEDAEAIETAYVAKLAGCSEQQTAPPEPSSAMEQDSSRAEQESPSGALGTSLTKLARRRSKAHLAFVASQPCLVCKASPCDAHHLKIAQPRSLGRKVSDEFTVPLCRKHHRELHRHGNEAAWWANMDVLPLEIAKNLYEAGPLRTASRTESQT